MNKADKHLEICNCLNTIYKIKNQRYNDSFGKGFKEYGLTMCCIRLEDKLNRIKALVQNPKLDNQAEESLLDTFKDLANYSIMSIIELTENKEGLT